MTYNDLIDRVKVKMEEYTPFAESAMIAAPESMGFDVKPVVSYIKKTLEESCNEVLMVLPLNLIRAERMTIIEQIKNQDGTGALGLGDNFLRVHSFKMKDWKKTLHYAEREDSDIAELQENPYTMGKVYKPVLVYHRSLSIFPRNKALSYYSCEKTSNHEIETSWQVSSFDKDNIQEDLADFYVLNCAKKVYSIFGMADKVTLMTTELNGLIETYSN
jgi:hypothetical protein